MRPGSPSTLVSEFTIPTPIQIGGKKTRVYLLSGTKIIFQYGVVKISIKTCNIKFLLPLDATVIQMQASLPMKGLVLEQRLYRTTFRLLVLPRVYLLN